LLLFLPAVVSEVGYIIVFHIPFNCFEAGACVLLREGVCHIIDDAQVVSDSPVDVTHRPGQNIPETKWVQAQGSWRGDGPVAGGATQTTGMAGSLPH
jgi:hypothetical protein